MRKIFSFLIVNLIFLNAFAQDEIPLIGITKTLQATVCRIDVKPNRRGSIHNIYNAPPGWQILSFKPVAIANSKGASYRFTQTSSNFAFKSTSAIYSKFIELLELAAEKNVFQKYEGQINQMRSDFEKYYNKVIPTYSKITTTGFVAAAKEYKNGRAETVYLDLEIMLVYMPDTEEQVLQSLDYLKQIIKTEG